VNTELRSIAAKVERGDLSSAVENATFEGFGS